MSQTSRSAVHKAMVSASVTRASSRCVYFALMRFRFPIFSVVFRREIGDHLTR